MIISVTNQKGGVGKTTTAVNLGSCLAEKGHRTLIIDMDPQANASLGLGIDVYKQNGTMYNVLIDEQPLQEVVCETSMENLFLAPSHLDLSSADIMLANALDRPFILRRALAPVADSYTYVLIDCPPALNVLTINSLMAAGQLIIPLESKFYALAGMAKLSETVANIKAKLDHDLQLLGVLVTMFDTRTNVHRAIYEQIANYFGPKVFKTVIRVNIAISEAEIAHTPIILHNTNSHGAEDYRSLAEEILNVTAVAAG
jgi:chromosome partitioning protein